MQMGLVQEKNTVNSTKCACASGSFEEIVFLLRLTLQRAPNGGPPHVDLHGYGLCPVVGSWVTSQRYLVGTHVIAKHMVLVLPSIVENSH